MFLCIMKLLLILSVLHPGIICLVTCGYTNVQVNGSVVRSTSNHVNIPLQFILLTLNLNTQIGSMTLYTQNTVILKLANEA